jgi:DNA-binding transcriptional ArsR family regulator
VADRDEPLELETRRRIYQFLEQHPGEHMREIGRSLNIAMGTLEYHLHYLIKSGLLTTREDQRFTRYFPAGGMDRRDKDVLAVVRQKVPRQIAAHLLLHPGASHGEILRHFSLSASTLSFHLKKLLRSGIATQAKEGRENHYQITDPDTIARVLITYRASFLDDVVDRFAEAWLSIVPREPATAAVAPPSSGGSAAQLGASGGSPSVIGGGEGSGEGVGGEGNRTASLVRRLLAALDRAGRAARRIPWPRDPVG